MTDSKTAKARLIQTFRYLKRLNELRNPVPQRLGEYRRVLRLADWPQHPCIMIPDYSGRDYSSHEDQSQDNEPLIRVRRAKLIPCPEPPRELDGWLTSSWKSADEELEVIQSRDYNDAITGSVITENFDASDERVNALNNWMPTRTRWAQKELPSVVARQVFETIYLLYTMMSRDGDRLELILADGMLYLHDYDIQHPVLLQSVSLIFDPSRPEFSFAPDIEKIELHSALLRRISIIETTMIADLQQELDAEPVEPLGGTETRRFFERVMQGLFKNGEFLEYKKPLNELPMPCLWREPVIFVRPRAAGLSTTLDNVIEDLESEEAEVPSGLGRIMGIDLNSSSHNSDVDKTDQINSLKSDEQPDILFTKPANREQSEIANRIEHAKSVIVQGPPGTGKTHTIANLIGHLLSERKTVLVTAHTTKALRVLREKVAPQLQPLCISVLHHDSYGKDQLQYTAKEILDRLSRSDSAKLRQEAAEWRIRRTALMQKSEKLNLKLRDAKNSEVDEIVFDGNGIRPIQVAKYLKDRREPDSWIPGPITPNTECPLDNSEVSMIYDWHSRTTRDDEAELGVGQPDISKIMTPADFKLLSDARKKLGEQARAHQPELWDDKVVNDCTSDDLTRLIDSVRSAEITLNNDEKWLWEILYAGWRGGDLSETWSGLLDAIQSLMDYSEKSFLLESIHGPQLPQSGELHEFIPILEEIVDYMEAGKSMGHFKRLTKPKWRKFVDSCSVSSGHPTNLEEFKALQCKATLQRDRESFVERWSRTVLIHDGPSIASSTPERSAQQWKTNISSRLAWKTEVWKPLFVQFGDAGFRWDRWLSKCHAQLGRYGELDLIRKGISADLVQIIMAQLAKVKQVEQTKKLQNQRDYLAGFPESQIAGNIQVSQDSWNVEQYRVWYRALARILGLSSSFTTREALLERLKPDARNWVEVIRQRTKPHDGNIPPGAGNCVDAWKWRQWYQELEMRAIVSVNKLQDEYRDTVQKIQDASTEIIDCEAWASQRERTSLPQQQALAGYVQTIDKIGKGSGRRAPKLRRDARQLLAKARSAVPVWIMPLSRVYESFDPRRDKFDVVIIDEASQSDVTALAALYLGRSHVVVGDKEQVTPDAVGQRIDQVDRLIETDLQNIPNRHLYDGQISIYDLAEQAFGGVIALRQHFRSVPDIIQFSNRLSYDNKIEPLREASSANIVPALVSQRVKGYRTDSTNPVEAEEVASLIVACIRDRKYQTNEIGESTSYGVISLVGDQQALLIDQLLREHLLPDIHERHRILCGSAAQFQGDERDVVFLSMVDSPPSDGRLGFRGFGAQKVFKKRFNVAVSRARNQLWVVHSVDPVQHLKAGDLRRRLIEHARDPSALWREFQDQAERTESEFEKQVLQMLSLRGYHVEPQWPVGRFRIDLVVVGHHRKLAVECDGERWHRTEDQRSYDFDRQMLLEQQGWIFARIRGSLFFRDKERAMEPVFSKLEDLGIKPQDMQLEEADLPAGVERVRQMAQELRRDWTEMKQSTNSTE